MNKKVETIVFTNILPMDDQVVEKWQWIHSDDIVKKPMDDQCGGDLQWIHSDKVNKPIITFYKCVYRPFTNYSVEAVEQSRL